METAVMGLIGAIFGSLVGYLGSRKLSGAQVNNTNANTIELQSKTINELWRKLDALRDEFNKSQELLEQKDDEISELKDYFRELLQWLEGNGVTDYPKPKDSKLLETRPRMQAVAK